MNYWKSVRAYPMCIRDRKKTSKILKLFGSSVSASIRWWISYNIMTSNALTTLMYLSFFILVCICWKWMKISAARRYTFMKENIKFSIRSWNPSVANSITIVNSTNKYAFISRIFNRHETYAGYGLKLANELISHFLASILHYY